MKNFIEKFQITREGENIRVARGSSLPPAVIAEIKAKKPEILAFLLAEEKAKKDAYNLRQSKIAAIPGLSELRAAIEERWAHSAAITRMMEDEHNDGARPPKSPTGRNPDEIAKEFPVAALWLKAEDYENSSNVNKFSAGEKAQELILAGDIEAAKETLENWLPEEAFFD